MHSLKEKSPDAVPMWLSGTNVHDVASPRLPTQWHIPRPSLWHQQSTYDSGTQWQLHQPHTVGSTSSQCTTTSNLSLQSGTSNALLLTAANLAALHYDNCLPNKPVDTMSVASSTHFTVVNGLERRKSKPLPSCCWHSHQLSILIVAMSIIFLVAILLAVLYLEMRWRVIRPLEEQ